MKEKIFCLYTDGGSRGNPGPSACGVAIYEVTELGKLVQVDKFGKYIGNATNNIAEYTALIEGLTKCQILKANRINCFLDSLLVVNQLTGKFKIKNAKLIPLAQKIKILEKSFNGVKYQHIRRENNQIADSLVNQALDASL
jgi:ribonuclease HI